MKHLTKYAILGALLGMAISPRARAEFGPAMPVLQVNVTESGCAWVNVPAGNFNAQGRLEIEPGTVGRAQLIATAQAALLSGRNIQIHRVQRSTGGCWGITDKITDILLLK